MIILGFVFSNWITFGASYATTNFQWIFPIACQTLFAIYLLITVPFLVESPRWIANHKSLEQATLVIAQLRNLPEDHEEVIKVRDEIQMALEEEEGTSWTDIFKNGGQQNFRRMLLGVGALYMQQMSGINTIGYYLPVILKNYVGLSTTMSHIVAAIGSMNYLFFSLLPIWFIEKFGRRTWMLWGAAGMTVVAALIAVGLRFESPVLSTMMYFLFYDVFAVR